MDDLTLLLQPINMSRFKQLREELRQLTLEQSESLQQQTFLGINQTELDRQERDQAHPRTVC
jgi:hypothetical protein